MRLTGGTFGGRKLKAPEGLGTRPTTDRVREAMFNILAHHDFETGKDDFFQDCVVLDAFAGTGALGLEALSRGAAQAFFFEKNRNALKYLKENISSLGLEARTTIFAFDAMHPPPAPKPCSLVFLDPPYHKGLGSVALDAFEQAGWLAQGAIAVFETAKDEHFENKELFPELFFRRHGNTTLHFLKRIT